MSTRAGLFEDSEEQSVDFDVSGFKPAARSEPGPSAQEIRDVSERSNFRSREPTASVAIEPPLHQPKRSPRLHRTGRNVQFNVKLRADSIEAIYRIADQQTWTMGETVERALAALQKELEAQP